MNAENTTVPTSVGADQHSHGGDRSGIFTQTVTIGTIAHVHKLSCSDAAVWAEFFKRGGRLDATAFSSFQTIDHRARWGGRAARVEAQRYQLALLWLYGRSCLSYSIDGTLVDRPEQTASPLLRFFVTSRYLQEILKQQAQLEIYLGDGGCEGLGLPYPISI